MASSPSPQLTAAEQPPTTTRPRPVPSRNESSTIKSHETTPAGSYSRAVSIARLGSPIPGTPFQAQAGTPPVRQVPTPSQLNNGHDGTTSVDVSKGPVDAAPTESALAAALRSSFPGTPPPMGTPPLRPLSPAPSNAPLYPPRSQHGSVDHGPFGSPTVHGDLDIVKRHLVGPSTVSSSPRGRARFAEGADLEAAVPGINDDEFSSLQLQGGDVTRPIYRLVEQREAEAQGISKSRSKSFMIPRDRAGDETLDIGSIKQPGGFRRDYLRRAAGSPSPSRAEVTPNGQRSAPRQPPQILTTSFIEFLSLYGHFAGEEFDDEDEADGYFSPNAYASGDEDNDPTEESALLGSSRRKRRSKKKAKHGASQKGAALLLLKSFVGTGVLFLPKAFLNGGMLFSSLVLLLVAALSYYCFILLCSTRLKVPASFGEMGNKLYGRHFRTLINFSLVISQIGFSSAYIVFVSENLQAFILAVTKCNTYIEVKWLILMQMVIFLPLSLYRNIQNIQKIAIVADVFILLGLLYLYYFDILTLANQHGIADITLFNKDDWTLFIGTAIFTFEGIGLIIPIQESMKSPQKFPFVMGVVMVVITVVFTSMGALSYAAYGSKTKTVVLLNMPQDSKFVNAVQFIYSLAILLSTPLQFFPAIEITSLAVFTKTGKNNPKVKWQKNMFRFCMVVMCALIAWMGADDLDKFVALVGSFACIPLVYIYPPMLHYRAIATKRWEYITDIALMLLGLVGMVYTTSLTISSWVNGSGGAKQPGYCDGR